AAGRGLHAARGAPVRLLHTGDAAHRSCPARDRRAAERGGDQAQPLRQPLPLHRLPGHPRGRRGARDSFVTVPVTSSDSVTVPGTSPAAVTVPGTGSKIGRSQPRRDAHEKLRGQAEFAGDMLVPRMLHGRVLRSPHAHARIVSIDTSAAEKLPGVIKVATGRDCEARMNPLPSFAPGPIYQWAIAVGKVRHVGETVAAVVAENRRIAEDAVDLIQVNYEALPAVVDPLKALEPGAPVLHEELGTNLSEARVMEFGDFEAAFAGAAEVVESDFY